MSADLGWLREGAWLTGERVRFYTRLLLVAYLAGIAMLLATARDGLDLQGVPIGQDFYSFWSSGVLANDGAAAATYKLSAEARQRLEEVGPVSPRNYIWPYPPVTLLITSVLARFPYAWALLLWTVATGVAYVLCLRRIVPHPSTVLVALAWPAFFVNALHGQNGCLSAALLAGGLLLLDKRPIAAGAMFGMLSFKPQLAVLLPVALAAGGHWRAIVSTAMTVAVLIGASILFFGLEVWQAYQWAGPASMKAILATPAEVYYGRISPYSAAHLLGADPAVAGVFQGLVTLAAAAVVFAAWRRSGPLLGKAALLAAAVPLATPHAFAYDLPIAGIAVAWLVREGLATQFRPWERSTIVVITAVPLLAPPLALVLPLQIGPLAEMLLVAVCARRLWASPPPERASALNLRAEVPRNG